jgi:hypothetical protein
VVGVGFEGQDVGGSDVRDTRTFGLELCGFFVTVLLEVLL